MNFDVKSFLCGAFAGLSAYACIRQLSNKKENKTKEGEVDCIFFSPKHSWLNCSLKSTKSSNKYCFDQSCSCCSYSKLIDFIMEAKTRLDICVYLISNDNLINYIIHLFKKGVFVRIITDKQMSEEANTSLLLMLIKEHIPVKVLNSSEIMHNKFVVIDKKKVITGSFNWTKQGVRNNYENAVVIRNQEIAKKYIEYFEECWNISYE